MQQRGSIERRTVTDDGVEREETIVKDLPPGPPRDGDEKAGGAVIGGVAGAAIGAVVGGPIGAVVGGAIGAASGATAGLVDEDSHDEVVVVTHEVSR